MNVHETVLSELVQANDKDKEWLENVRAIAVSTSTPAELWDTSVIEVSERISLRLELIQVILRKLLM